jgi:NADH-quinone oxidoreductase subunit L
VDHPLSPIALLPLAGFLLNGLVGGRAGKRFVSAVGCGLPILAFAVAVQCFVALSAGGTPLEDTLYRWTAIGDRAFDITFHFDRLTAVMALIVTGVGSLIHVYSVGYMKEDASYARYFAYLNLFLFFMLLLVLGRSLLVLFVGWEGVGLASYLLIGFWFDDPAKAAAGKKAFITNRVGDAGFLLGMFVLFNALGTLDMVSINRAFADGSPPGVSANLVGLLLFIGATGKSAQIPLHVWLPDAMAGPTPVSALIHAATMVTAGVYLVARLSGIYAHAPEASAVVAAIGACTAFFAATIAVVQTDIKKVLAYSTISQLGFMFVAAGVGAYGVAIFHLYTHAFFKACLFLGAGSVIHALAGEQDLRKMGGLARRIPITFATFAVATGAIAGLPPLAGFFSKDEILWFALAGERGAAVLFALAAVTALLTSFYMFRLLWLAFFGAPRMPSDVLHHVHESPPSMTGVLLVLAVLSAAAGFVALPHWLTPVLPEAAVRPAFEGRETFVVALSVALAFAGLGAAALVYGHGAARAARLAARFPVLHRLLAGKYFVDEAYDRALAKPLYWTSDRVFLRLGDKTLIDGTLHFFVWLGRRAAGAFSRVQSGSLHLYAFLLLTGIVIALAWSWRHG